jgi:hypothetical protein
MDHPHSAWLHVQAIDQELPAELGVGDDSVYRAVQTPLRARLKRPRLTGQQVVGRQHRRAARQQVPVDRLDREPLKVDHVACHRTSPQR